MISEICGIDPGQVHVALEDLGVQAERDHALLDPGAAALVDADHRPAGAQREIQDLDDLLAVHLAERAAEDGDVLGEHADVPAVDGAVAGDHAVAVGPVVGQAEVGRAVPGERVELDERARVEQQVDALPGGQLAPGVLPLDGLGRAGVDVLVHPPVQVGQLAGGGVRGEWWRRIGVRRGRCWLARCAGAVHRTRGHSLTGSPAESIHPPPGALPARCDSRDCVAGGARR